MKKLLCLVLVFCTPMVTFAQSVKEELQQKLDQLAPFSAEFTQTVSSYDGEELLTSNGSMLLQRPNKFRWETAEPDEQLIVSDGVDLWFYNPFVEQVSIYQLKDAITNTPFMLIAGADAQLWQDYRVSKKADEYTITVPGDDSVAIFTVKFARNKITNFSVQEKQGQLSTFALKNYTTVAKPADSEFTFTIPAGTDVDDQR